MHLSVMPTDGVAPTPPRTILWLMANGLDSEALGLWCRTHVACDAIETAAEFDKGLRRCDAFRPRLLVLDPAFGEQSVARTMVVVHAKHVGHLLLLDRRPREGRLVEILAEPLASYLSRQAGPQVLAAAIEAIFDHGRRVIDPALAGRVRRTPRGYEFRHTAGPASVAQLSIRERQVMRLLAEGKAVRECAVILGLAHSTIDNHKSRLMKKLGIHKASELTCRAIREGLIAL